MAICLLLRRQDDLARQDDGHRARSAFTRKSSIVRPNRLCTSSTAVDRSGPICAGLFTPSAEIEWHTKQPGLHEPARPARSSSAPRPSTSSGVCGSVRGAPATYSAGTVDLPPRQHQHRERLRLLGREVEVRHHRVGDERARILEVRHVPGERRRLARQAAVVVLLGRLVADEGEVGADRAAAPVDRRGRRGSPSRCTSLLARLIASAPFVSRS